MAKPPTVGRSPRRDLIDVDTAAEYLGVCRRTVRRMIADGKLVGYRVGPRLIRVDQAELDAIVQPIPTVGDAA